MADVAGYVLLGAVGAAGLAAAGYLLHALKSRLDDERRRGDAAVSYAQMLQVLFERSADGLLMCDAQGRILTANDAACTLLGEARGRLCGEPVTRWLPAPAAQGPAGAIPAPVEPVACGECTLRGGHPDTAIHVSIGVLASHVDGVSRWIVKVHDLTEQMRTQHALEKLARYDSLTGLPNRAHFRERLQQAMERARRQNRPMALYFLDLDRFKVVNDSLGHEAGDRLLKHVATLLTGCLRGTDAVMLRARRGDATLSRLGGDEFTLILEDVGGAEEAATIAQRLLDAMAVPFKVGDEEILVSASIGISLYPTDDVDLDGIIRHTDMAMYRSKALGRNTYSFFSDDLNAAVSARLSLEGSLRRALERGEFCLHYQPKADLVTRRVTGVEALLRWHCPGRGMVPPDRFISVLEDTGLIVPAGAWVIREACSQLSRWDAEGLPPISVAVNLSARQLRHPFLVSHVQDTLAETGIDPKRLELELTESLLMEDTEGNRGVLAAFQRLGIRLAIDDFGTGHSSLSYLRRLDVDTLKIDRSFVSQLPDDAEDAAIATAVVALGKSLDMKVVAEGVETEAQAQFLRDLGCSEMQGWLLSRALPAADLGRQLKLWHREHLARVQPQRYASAHDLDLPNIVIAQSRLPGGEPARVPADSTGGP